MSTNNKLLATGSLAVPVLKI